ncbi:unnamed protein product [Linum tenue]|uniref:F-box domain-containing protein n=1 Tax=Linum tenue TaxID=586396 RepID=A0AAV0IKA6_9ROSI|nr:unnamed protein product [Linum tenue]
MEAVTAGSARFRPLLRSCNTVRKAAASSSNAGKLGVCGTKQAGLRRKRQREAEGRPVSAKSDSLISDIPDSLLIYILQRLPNPRSVCACKSVCKRWNLLISDPDTLHQLVSRHRINLTGEMEERRPLLIYFDRPQTHESIVRSIVPSHFLSNNDDRHTIQVISCCNDLLLCGRIRPKNRYRRRFFVCNPFTKHCVTLPLVPRHLTCREGFYFGTHRSGTEMEASLIGFVCEPCFYYDDASSSSSHVGTTLLKNPKFRFRVVFFFKSRNGLGVTTFCSESWEWKFSSYGYQEVEVEETVIPPTAPYIGIGSAHSTSTSAGTKLFWKTAQAKVAVYDPFSEQSPPQINLVDCSHLWSNDIVNNNFLVGVSQGFLRGMVFPRPGPSTYNKDGFFSLWKLGEDQDLVGGYRWSLDYQVSMRVLYNVIVRRHKMNKIEGGRRKKTRLGVLGVHPSRPEVIYFECRDYAKKHNHDPFFFDFNHHFRDGRIGDLKLPEDYSYDPIYVVPFDVLRHKVVGEIIPIADINATHLRFKYWGRFGVGDPIGWAVFQPSIPFWPTPIPVPDVATEFAEEPEENIKEGTLGFMYSVW